MGGTVHTHDRRRWAHVVVLTLAVIGALGVVAPAALAFDPIDVVCDNGNNTMHDDGVIFTSCVSCHGTNDYSVPVDTAKCLVCHLGGFENRPVESDFSTCWSCHYPGENQDVVQNEVEDQAFDGCAAETDCHDIEPAANLPHFGANTKTCTDGCHRSSSQSTPNGSPHHDDGKANCYDCHDGVRALEEVHEPYGEARDYDFGGPYPYCYTCHVGYEQTHPEPESVVHRTTQPSYTPAPVVYGGTAKVYGYLYAVQADGTLVRVPNTAISLLQYRGTPEFDWNTLQVKLTMTDDPATTANETGKYVFDPVAPLKNTSYAALTKGAIIGDTVVKPARGTVLVKVAPKVTETLNKTSLALGGTITVKGKVVPWKTGGKVKWVFQRYIDGTWKTVTTTATRVLTDVDVVDPLVADYSTASYTYKPGKRGTWRVKTVYVANTDYTTASSIYKKFVVK